MSGIRKFPNVAGIPGTTKRKIMNTPCYREEHVVGVWIRNDLRPREGQLSSHHHRGESASNEEDHDGKEVKEADPFVVG